MANTSLFPRLKKLFSSDVLVRNVGGDQLKIADINHIQTTGKYRTNSLLDRFSRLYMYTNHNNFNPNVNYQTLRSQLYSDYESMDGDPIIASTLDILADEVGLRNDFGQVLSINSSDESLKGVLENLYYDILNIEFNLWSWARNMCKYGDFFLKLEISEEFGVFNVIPYTVYQMSRHEGVDEREPDRVIYTLSLDGLATTQDPTGFSLNDTDNRITLDNYEVAHFRLISDTSFLPYGRSYLEPARRIFKQLTLMEDAMLIHRIMRAPDKRTFYINVGQLPPNEVEQFMKKTIGEMKKTPYVNPQTGEYNLKFNVQNMMEDFYIPVRGNDTSTRIEHTPGLNYDGIKDIEYLRDKMFAALKVPKAYFGYEGDLNGKATLAAEDIRFARTVERLQKILESELTKIGIVHLYSQGYKGESLVNFEIKLTNPSIIFEQEKVALLQEKVELAQNMMDSKLFPTDFIYSEIFNVGEDAYDEFRNLIKEDSIRVFRHTQIENEGNDPLESGKAYGTPHVLASMYGRRDSTTNRIPLGYSEEKEAKVGRPQIHNSMVGTQEDPLGGSDRLGVHGMHGGYPSDNDQVLEQAKAETENLPEQTRKMLSKLKEKLYSTHQSNDTSKLLKEDNILDYEE
jgi:hypothetical protein